MTEQEIFDNVVAHARKQKVRAAIEGKSETTYICKYRTEDGLKCFVGALIKDEHYLPRVEGQSITSLYVVDALKASGVLENGYSERKINLLTSLQLVHDRTLPYQWEEELQWLAGEYGLTYTPPKPEEQQT